MTARVTDTRVYDAVLDIVATAGYRGATTRRIAESAGINEVTLFRRWGDKKHLLGAAIDAEIGLFRVGDVTGDVTGDVAVDLEEVVELHTRLYRHRGGLVVALLLEATLDPEVAELLREPSAVLTRLEELVTSYQNSGTLRREPPREAVEALLGPLLMFAVLQRVGLRPAAAPPAASSVVRRFLDGHALVPA